MASQQPPARPWFRFATMAAPSAPVPSPTPQPDPVLQARPSAIRPKFWATTLPTQTQEPAPAAPAPPITTNQVPPTSVAPITTSATTAPAPAPTKQTPSASAPAPAPAQLKSSLSPNSRNIRHPPTPLTLPPAQLKSDNIQELNTLEIKQKTVFVQETKEKSKASPHVHLPRHISEPPNSTAPHKGEREGSKNAPYEDKDKYKKTLDSDFGMRIVTNAGDNKGAIMELRSSRKKQESGNNFHKIGNFRTWGDGEKTGRDSSSSGSSEEGKSKKNKEVDRAVTKALSIPYVNSNVQAVNNSILFNATCSHHDPGVHISLSRTAARSGRGLKVKKHMSKDD